MAYFDYNGKKIYYQELGSGTPCVFLHGNTASSKMFEFLLPLYRDDMKIILIDFLGNGKSDRLASFPEEMWIDQGYQIVELCRNLNCGKVNLIGTSGGAYAAINAALEMPELFRKVVADSFDGSTLPAGFGDGIIRERQAAKKDEHCCELKSLYLYKRFQGRGLGRNLLETVIAEAKRTGYREMYLDTLSTSTRAITLYEKAGFAITERYNENRDADLFMVLEIRAEKR